MKPYKNNKTLSLTILSMLLLNGCATTEEKQKDAFKVPSSFLKSGNAAKPENEAPDAVERKQNTFNEVKISGLGNIPASAALLVQLPKFSSDEPLTVAANELPLPQLAQYIFGELLELSYVMSPDVEAMTSQVALNLQTEVTPKELFEIGRQLMTSQGVELYTKNNIVYLAKAAGTGSNKSVGIGGQLSDLPESGEQIIQLVPYTFNSVRGISNITSKLTAAQVFADTQNRLLVIEGSRSDVERTLQIVRMLDVPDAKGRDVRLLSMVFLSPDEMIKQVGELLKAEGIIQGEDLAMVALPRLNSVVVYAASPVLADRVSMWAQRLDVASGGESTRFFVYRPQYAKAEEMIQSVQALLSGTGANSSGRPSTGGSTANPATGQSQSSGGASPSATAAAQGIRVSVDKPQNALIVQATPSRYQEIYSLLQQMDRLPGQVAMQVMIVEKDITDEQSLGFGDLKYDSTANKPQSANATLSPNGGTINFGIIDGDFSTTLNMINKQTDTKVLSRPYLIVKDGESAAINSGDQIPIITSQSNNDLTPGTIRNQVQYRSTGISFSVTPTINAGGLISLEVTSETSKAEDLSANSDLPSPTIKNRSLTTSVMIESGKTVILGGLIKEDLTDGDSKVPLFGDIPLLGKLFQYKSNKVSRAELMIIITPRIVRSTSEMEEFGQKLSELYSFPVDQK